MARWEKFAQSKGIVKKKRSKMVWDEATQQWAPRYGYGRANNPKDKLQDWVIEAKPGDDPSVDPFEARATERRTKLGKQKAQQERNRREAAHAAGSKGAGAGIAKSALQVRRGQHPHRRRHLHRRHHHRPSRHVHLHLHLPAAG